MPSQQKTYSKTLVLHAFRDAVAEGCQHHDGYVRVVEFDAPCDVEDGVVLGSGHTDDEVDLSALHLCLGLFEVVDLQEAWREAESKLGVLGEDFLIHTAVVLQHEGIVGVRHNQDVIDPLQHEVHEGSIFQCHNYLYWELYGGVKWEVKPASWLGVKLFELDDSFWRLVFGIVHFNFLFNSLFNFQFLISTLPSIV